MGKELATTTAHYNENTESLVNRMRRRGKIKSEKRKRGERDNQNKISEPAQNERGGGNKRNPATHNAIL